MRIACATSRQTVPVHNVKFSHRSIKRRFDDGRPLANLVEQLRRDEVHPLRDSFFTSSGVEFPRYTHQQRQSSAILLKEVPARTERKRDGNDCHREARKKLRNL